MNENKHACILAIACVGLLAGCGARSTGPAYSVGLTVSGLAGTLLLTDSPSDSTASGDPASPRGIANAAPEAQNLSVSVDGTYSFAQRLPDGAQYAVSVLIQPTNETCTVANGAGSIAGADVTGVSVTCLTNRFTTASVVTSLDNSVPGAVTAKIAKVVSTAGSASLGNSLDVPAIAAGDEPVVYAVDINENTVLASIVSSAHVTLGADSTALALSRVLLGAVPANFKASDVDAAIRGTAAYPRLVAVIGAAVAAGTSPLSSAAVFDTLNTVTSQLPPAVLPQLAPAADHNAERRTREGSPAADPGPAKLFGWRGSNIQALFLAGGGNASNIKVANGMSIAWDASSSDNYGNRRCPEGHGRSDRCSVLLPAAAVVRQAAVPAGQLAQGLPTGEVPASSGSTVKLTLSQEDDSRRANMLHIVQDGARFAVATVSGAQADRLPQNCVNDLTGVMLPAEALASLAANRASVNFQKYLDTIGTSAAVGDALTQKLAACFGGSYTSTSNVAAFTRATLLFYRQFGLWVTRDVASVANAANEGLAMGLTLYYWNDSGTTVSVSQGHVAAATAVRKP